MLSKSIAVAADAGYKTPHIAKVMIDNGIRPCLPYTRPRGKKGYLRKSEFHYESQKEFLSLYRVQAPSFPVLPNIKAITQNNE